MLSIYFTPAKLSIYSDTYNIKMRKCEKAAAAPGETEAAAVAKSHVRRMTEDGKAEHICHTVSR